MWSVFGSHSLPLPPRIYPLFQQLYATLPEYTPPSQNIPPFQQMYVRPYPPEISPPPFLEHIPFSTTMILCDPPRIYPFLPESPPPFQSIYVCDNNYMRPSHPSPQNIPVFQQLYATFPESTPPSQNIGLPPFSTNVYVRLSQNLPLPPRIYPPFQQLYATLPESTPPFQNISPFQQMYVRPSQNLPLPPRIYPLFNNYNIMRPSQDLLLLPRIHPPFQPIYVCDPPCLWRPLPLSVTP